MNRYPDFPESDPSVTELLKDVGLIDSTFFNHYAAQRGTAVHSACHYLDENDLDRSTVSDEIAPYLEGYEKFKKESGMTFDIIEKPLYSSVYRLKGRPDRVNTKPAIVLDLKTGIPQEWHKWQLALYHILAFPASVIGKRFGLYLNNNGGYRLEEYRDRHDFNVASAAVTIYWAKRSA